MKKKITIAHLHVWDKNNKGDHAIVLAVQELLKKYFSGCRIIDYPVSLLKDGTLKEAEKINQADFVIIGGGGIFYSYFLPYSQEFISIITKPIIIFGAGYIREVDAPDLSRVAAKSVAFLANQATMAGVRDFNTQKFLIQYGVEPSKIKVIGDPAALLSEKKPSVVKLKKLGLNNLEGKKTNPQKLLDRQKKDKTGQVIRIGLNLNYSGWLGFGKWHDDILNAYRETAEYFQKEYGGEDGSGVEIYYLKHHPGEDKIYPELKINNLRIVDLPPVEQKYAYGRMDLIIGMMLHVGVMAFGAGTPEISVAYDLRNYSFAEFIGRPELVVDLDKLKRGELLKNAQIVFDKKYFYHKEFVSKRKSILKLQESFLKKIRII